MLAFTGLMLAIWHLAVRFEIVNRTFVADLADAITVILRQIGSGALLESVLATITRMASGWLLASLLGILIGAVIGSSRLAQQALMPVLEAMRPLPASAVIPVAILLIGLNDTMSIVIIAFGSLWPALLATIHGFRSVPPQLREVGTMLEMGRLRYFLTISLPSALVDIIPGLRIGLALSLILTVVTEMQALLRGVGYDIFMAQRLYRSADLYAGLIVIGMIGFFINQLLLISERRLLPWTTRQAR
ncbi:MAG TPA: ABC transporter permease [Beijerinckiaceae bacterium]|nr:ABC transporter permease [Beijerinckiaceae bacterium]